MPSQLVTLGCHIQASPEIVFDFFSDHESFGRIWPGKTTRVRTSTNPNYPNDVGSVRQIKVGPLCFEETQITCDRPVLIEYTLTKNGPIKNHFGSIRLSQSDTGGTTIDYTIQFDPKVPCTGALTAKILKSDWEKGIPPIIAELERQAASE